MTREPSRRMICRLPRTPKIRPKSMSPIPPNACACWAATLDRPSGLIEIRAPISGFITDQQVTNAAGVAGLGSPNPFTIADLTSVWILCDVYENDLVNVRLGEKADIRLNAYPGRVFSGTIGNIGPILDPGIRTAKVRIEMRNPGLMRPGMFVSATFH